MELSNDVYRLLYELKQNHPHTFLHCVRVAKYSQMLGEELYLDADDMEMLKLAGLLHDIGKLSVSNEILHKPGPLTPEELSEIQKHTEYGVALLKGSGLSDEKLLKIVSSHHTRFDTRAQEAPSKDEMPFLARIIAVADSFDAITSDRCYRKKQDIEFAISELQKGSGSQFDPRLTAVFLTILKEKGEILPENPTPDFEL